MTQAHLFSLLVNVYNLTNTLLIFLLYTRSLGLKAWSVASVSSRWSSGFRKKVVLSAFPWGDTLAALAPQRDGMGRWGLWEVIRVR